MQYIIPTATFTVVGYCILIVLPQVQYCAIDTLVLVVLLKVFASLFNLL